MIFVTIGNATQGFERLLRAMDDAAAKGAFGGEEVLLQIGSSRFEPKAARAVRFLAPHEFTATVASASVVVCHAGAGTLHHVFSSGKIPVVVPRRLQFGELRDDHQVEIVEALAAEGRIIPVHDLNELPAAVARARSTPVQVRSAAESRMAELVAAELKRIESAKRK